ncbi:hypothetical protein HDU96_001719 [Phlyctochytrium bullatum]|nr:hypothetical protein HDU96_001719 [Phlyctochytrium bullatum]
MASSTPNPATAASSSSPAPAPPIWTPVLNLHASVGAIAQACQALSRRPRNPVDEEDPASPYKRRRMDIDEKQFHVTISVPAEQCSDLLVAGLLRGVEESSENVASKVEAVQLPKNVEMLHQAAKLGHVLTVRKLLASETPFDVKDKDGLLPLQKSYSLPVWVAFAEKMSVPKDTDLLEAAKCGKGVATRLLLATGSDPAKADENGVTPLHLAVMGGHEDVVGALLKFRKGDRKWLNSRACIPNVKLPQNVTALHLAAIHDNLQILIALLNHHDVDVEARDSDYATPLHRAVMAGNAKAVEVLLQRKACVQTRLVDDKQNRTPSMTPLMLGAREGRVDICRLLVEYGANVNDVNDDMESAIFAAVRGKHPDVVELLIEFDADLNVENKSKKTVRRVARKEGTEEIVEILKQHGGHK